MEVDTGIKDQEMKSGTGILDLPPELLERVAAFTVDLDASWADRISNDLPLRLVHTRFDECFTPAIFESWRVNFNRQKYELYSHSSGYDDVDFFFVTLCANNARIAGCVRHLTFTEGEDYDRKPSAQMLEWIDKYSSHILEWIDKYNTVIRFCAELCPNITSLRISLIHFGNPVRFRAPPKLEKLHLHAYLPWTLALSAESDSGSVLRQISLDSAEVLFPPTREQQGITLSNVLGKKERAPHCLDELVMTAADVVFMAALTRLLPIQPTSLLITVNEVPGQSDLSDDESDVSADVSGDPEWIGAGLDLLGDSAFTAQLSDFTLLEGQFCNIDGFNNVCERFEKVLADGWTMFSSEIYPNNATLARVTWTKHRK